MSLLGEPMKARQRLLPLILWLSSVNVKYSLDDVIIRTGLDAFNVSVLLLTRTYLANLITLRVYVIKYNQQAIAQS